MRVKDRYYLSAVDETGMGSGMYFLAELATELALAQDVCTARFCLSYHLGFQEIDRLLQRFRGSLDPDVQSHVGTHAGR